MHHFLYFYSWCIHGYDYLRLSLMFGIIWISHAHKNKHFTSRSPAPDVHHFSPFITYSSPSRTADEHIFVASEEATAGSVIAKADLISPFNNGFNHLSCCSSFAYLPKLPYCQYLAEQLNISEAIPDLPYFS